MSDKNTSQIDAYLSGKMSEVERAAFEDEMADDESLKKQVHLFELERQAAIVLLQEEYREKLARHLTPSAKKEEKAGAEKVPVRPTHSIRNIVSIAASVVVLISLGCFWWIPHHYSNEAILQSFTVEAKGAVVKGNTDTKNSLSFDKAAKAYFNNPKDTTAKMLLEQIPDSLNQEYRSAQYFLAFWYFHQQDYDEAIRRIDQVLLNLPHSLKKEGVQDLEWTRLLALVGANQLDEAFYKDLQDLKDNGTPKIRTEISHLESKLASYWRKWAQ